MPGSKRDPTDLPGWLWLGLPPVMLLLLVVAAAAGPDYVGAITRSDHDPRGTGIAEHATVLVLVPGIVAGFAVFRRRRHLPDARIGWWVLAWTLACVYFAGEKMSWGQHLIGWQSPELFQDINRQKETNIHNISSWLDRKPRAVVELWVMIAGLLLPVWQRVRGAVPDAASRAYWIWPSFVVVPSAALFLLFRLHRWFADPATSGYFNWLSESEVREYYIALFLSLYLLSIWRRLRATEPRSTPSAAP